MIAGLSYDRLVIPANFRLAPLSSDTETTCHLLPKAGVIWTPFKDTTLRAAYSESVGGASFDQSFQLEPAQVAGFSQAFRSLIPESVAGANAGATFTSYGVSLEQKFSSRTYLAVAGEILESTAKLHDGAFEFNNLGGPFLSSVREQLDFQEKSVSVSLHQLVGRAWAFGAVYRVSHAELKSDFTEVTDDAAAATGFIPRRTFSGLLQTLDIHAIYQHQIGLFAEIKGSWTRQNNGAAFKALAGDDFWQWDVLAGYRFPRRKAEITIGVLNLFNRDYHLSPLNLYQEKPRDRTFYAQFAFHF